VAEHYARTQRARAMWLGGGRTSVPASSLNQERARGWARPH
jgi:hypothetical protein